MARKKWISVVLSAAMIAGALTMAVPAHAGEGEVQEITWMFWDDLEASEDNIT